MQSQREELWSVAEELYRNPETGLNEVRAAELLTTLLEREGFAVERGLAGMPTAFRAVTGEAGPTFAILAEMDALPELGHACGHNIIAAAAVGAACALRRVLAATDARIVVLGTPAEEMGVGKVAMINAGLFEGVDFVIMVHPSSRRRVFKQWLGLAKIRYLFHGKPAHAAAYPEEGINALDGVIQTFNSVNALRQQLRSDVRVHGIITDGGKAPNIIPERAACFFYVRADDLEEMLAVRERVTDCARGAALATGCRLEVLTEPGVLAPLRILSSYSQVYAEQLAFLGLETSNAPPNINKGSSDIGNVSRVVPTIHPHVPIGPGLHIHTEEFARATVAEGGRQAVMEGAMAMALTVAEIAARPALQDEIRQEFLTVG